MKKKVIIISNTVGVIYKFKFELLEELLRRNYEVYLFAQNENENEYVEEMKKIGVNYIEIKISRRGINPLKDFRLILDYLNNILKIKPDYIFTFTVKPNIYGAMLAKILKIKYSSTITGLGTAFQKNNLIFKVIKFLYKKSLKNTEGVFFENHENLKFFIDNKIIAKDKAILVSGSGVNLKKFYPMKKNRNNNKRIYLFMGRIMKEKGIEEFLGAAKEIEKKYKNMEFWILGNYEEEKYKSIITELQEEGIIKYLGVKKDVREILKEIDFLVQPSYHEGLSNVILEASAMGKLVLASNIPGCREAIVDKKYLFFPQDTNSLIECIERNKDENNEDQMEFVKKNFNRKNVVKENLKILERNMKC